MKKKIAIIGATSYIAKGIVFELMSDDIYDLFLYDRSVSQLDNYPFKLDRIKKIGESENFAIDNPDIVINCIGIGDPKKLKQSGGLIFSLTERFDNLVIDYLIKNKKAKYINLSSGAIYGTEINSPIDAGFITNIDMNNITPKIFYSIAKINAEAKHRSNSDLSIIDLRVFSYFSRFVNLDSSFFLSEVITAVINNKTLITNTTEMTRDFIGPSDLGSLIKLCIEKNVGNTAIDVYSKHPIDKKRILEFFVKKYSLKVTYADAQQIINASGEKNKYYSVNYQPARGLGYQPAHSSLDTIINESNYLLGEANG